MYPTNGSSLPPLTIDSKTYTADFNGAYVVDGQTLVPGTPAITISGTPVSLALGASNVVVSGSTKFLHPTYGGSLPPITVGSQIYDANADGAYVMAAKAGTPVIVIAATAGAGLASSAVYTMDSQIYTQQYPLLMAL